MASQAKTGKISKKIFASIIILIVVVASASAAAVFMVSRATSPTTTQPNNWSITVNGTSAVAMDQSDFATLVAGSTATYTDSGGTTWSGTPLHHLVVWAENNGAINSSLLTSGYVVKVIGAGNSFATFNDTQIYMNMNIMVANTANGAALTGSNAPLILTGSEVALNEKIVGITQIQILPIQDFN